MLLGAGTRHTGGGGGRGWRAAGGAIAVAAVLGGAAATASAAGDDAAPAGTPWEPITAPPQEPERKPGRRHASTADMIEEVFPSLIKIQGVVGDRECGGTFGGWQG